MSGAGTEITTELLAHNPKLEHQQETLCVLTLHKLHVPYEQGLHGSITERPDPHIRIVTLHKRSSKQTGKGFRLENNFNHILPPLSGVMAGSNMHTIVFLNCTLSFALPMQIYLVCVLLELQCCSGAWS
jgi:hypothetical protein